MSPSEVRQVKRPRVSLSCIVCRRRKVRCGREHPQCANCVRMKEKCLYNPTTDNELTGQGYEYATAVQDKSIKGQESHTKELTWAHWVPGGTENRIDPGHDPRSPSLAGAPGAGLQSRLTRATRKQAAMDHITMPDSEDAIKLSAGQDTPTEVTRRTASVPMPLAVGSPSASSPDTPASPQDGYLSLRRGGGARYIGQTFWGFVAGRERLSDGFFDDNCNADPELPPLHISSLGMAKLLRSLPTKPVSDALLDVFFLIVWPLAPLVHRPTLRADYDEFWNWCRDNMNALPPQKIRDDPTFFCLLFAALYCGASAAPSASWTSPELWGLRRETTIQSLKEAYEMSLSSCRHLEHPTLNTLVSTLLTWPFLEWPREPMGEAVALSATVRLSHSMGLHRDSASSSALSPVDREIRCRVWWYIVRLDVQSSMSSGLPLCCGSEALEAVNMLNDTYDQEIGNPGPGLLKQSIAIMFAIGCAETARLSSRIIAHLQSGRGLRRDAFAELVTAAKEHQEKIDALISRIPSQGIPERGFIPSRLTNTSPSTHPALHRDDATEPTVLGAWMRAVLTLLKFDVAVLLHKSFLPPPESSNPEACKAWTSMLQLCLSYFRILLPIYQASAFSPYIWFHRSYVGPLQCLFLTLVYLESFKGAHSKENLVARYYVDEITEHVLDLYQTIRPSIADERPDSRSKAGPSKERLPVAIQTLVDLQSRLDSSTTTPPPMNTGTNPGPANSIYMADDFSIFCTRLTELSSSLIDQ
ncbi:hypothetical protein BJX68DRAFT_261753 [Aspergillus pseudodeflectus]|uniref:Zn(2)-C6 fungal-type domain-containing protein n=1 Tax=Aspergillus pseudodeflectus TaxID=176178 RepID=A0ABR4L438_9EURO